MKAFDPVGILTHPIEVSLVDEMLEMASRHPAVDRLFCMEICAQLRYLTRQEILDEFRLMCS